ncbi:MAG: hypothetical protein DRP49_05560 [Spirochaetes bacterium]|nr:MAG: hypothetical protein DRP49_05560 [Spirochaetota bacterium]
MLNRSGNNYQSAYSCNGNLYPNNLKSFLFPLFCTMYSGFIPELILGKTDFEIFPKEGAKKYRGDGRAVIKNGISRTGAEPWTRSRQRLARKFTFVAMFLGSACDALPEANPLYSSHFAWDSTRGTNTEKGTGLGLVLYREFFDCHGGNIDVESSPGKGRIFTVTLLHPGIS